MGESALKMHAAGAKRNDLIKAIEKDPKVHEFIKPAAAASKSSSMTSLTVDQHKNSTSGSSAQAVSGGRSVSVGIASFVSPQESLSAEILWTLKSVTGHYSYRSSNVVDLLFQRMFPDSNVERS